MADTDCKGVYTSGYPLGRMNSSGTTPFIFEIGLSLGGEGIVVYSVKENEFKLGVRGLLSPLVSPFTLTPFDIVYVVQLGQLLCVIVCECRTIV